MIRLVAAAALALQALAASPNIGAGDHALLCLDTLGVNIGATCTRYTGSRINAAPAICQCLNTALPVSAPYCARGEAPQAETADYDRARFAAARAGGTLVGKSYRGRSFCVRAP